MTVSLRFSSIYIMVVIATAIVAFLGFQLNSQILPDAPIEGIRVTMFSDEGFKLWNLKGNTASYLDNGVVEVMGMDLEVFQGETGKDVDMSIFASEAIYKSDERAVSGEGGVVVEGDFYNIEGDSWSYSQDDRIVKVTSNVKVIIDYELDAFLK